MAKYALVKNSEQPNFIEIHRMGLIYKLFGACEGTRIAYEQTEELALQWLKRHTSRKREVVKEVEL